MTEPPKREVKGILPTYIGFLMDKINKIYNAWDEGNVELALNRACRLVYFLVDDLKKKIWDDMQAITKEMNQAYQLHGVDWYMAQLNSNKTAHQTATLRLPQFLDKIIRLMDTKDYFELHKKSVLTGKELGY